MFEIKVTVESPDLSNAIGELAKAISGIFVDSDVSDISDTVARIPIPAVENAPESAPDPILEKTAEPVVTAAEEKPAVAEEKPIEIATPAEPKAPIDLEAISRAGAGLVDQGKMDQVIGILQQKYGLMAITQLKPEQYDAFAADLRALGADI